MCSEAILRQVWVVRLTSYNAYAVLTVMVWDLLLTIEDEIEYIWSKPGSSYYKWVYIFCRYVPLICQIYNIFFVSWMVAGVAIHHCKAWIIYQSVVVQMMLVLVDGLLMTRVYALWNGSRKIATILTTELIIEISCMCTSTFFIMSDFRPGPMCLFDRAPPQIIYFSVSAAVTQITLVVLTGWKQFTASRYGWGRTPLVSLVLRDGSFTAIVNLTIFCFPLMNILLEIDTNDIIFYWLLSILSICKQGCRLILNIHRLSSTGFTGENDDDDAFALTSMFSFLGVSDSDSKHSSTQSSSSS